MKSTFKQKVLKIVAKIPRGKVLTYGQVASHAGNSKASRAVGQIMAQNKNPKIPCHRVIGVNQRLAGYSRKGGIKAKFKKLQKEGVEIALRY